jgi:hypothetical protein
MLRVLTKLGPLPIGSASLFLIVLLDLLLS